MRSTPKKLVSKTVIPDLLSEVVGKVAGNAKSWILACPRCTKEDKLYIRKTDGRFVCWSCAATGFQGAPEIALSEITGKSVRELRSILYGEDGPTGEVALAIDPIGFLEDEAEQSVPWLPTVEPHPDFRDLDSPWGRRGAEYLASRGIPLEVAQKYGIVYWPSQRRVVFPVRSGDGRLVGWQSRLVVESEYWDEEELRQVSIPKALTYEGLEKSQSLMFCDKLRGDFAVLCEGPVDAIKCDLVGNAVATMGKMVSPYQMSLLLNSGIRRLYLGLDLDAAAEIAQIVEQYTGVVDIYDMRPPPGKDLGDMNFSEVQDLYNSAKQVTSANLFLYLKEYYAAD